MKGQAKRYRQLLPQQQHQELDYLDEKNSDKFKTLLSDFPERELLKHMNEIYSKYPEVAKFVATLAQKALPKPLKKASALETPAALPLKTPPKPQEETSAQPIIYEPVVGCKKRGKEISLEWETAYKQETYFLPQQLKFLNGETIVLSAETMKVLSQNCSPEGFKKICQKNLNINAVNFLRILSDLGCHDNIKDFASCTTFLDDTSFAHLLDDAYEVGAEKLALRYTYDRYEMFGKPIFTSIADRLLELTISTQALQKLCQVSPTARLQVKTNGKLVYQDSFTFRVFMNSAGCFDTLNPSDLRHKIYLALYQNKEPEEIVQLLVLAKEWGIDFLQKRYSDAFSKICLDLIELASSVDDVNLMITGIDDIIYALNLNIKYSQSGLDQKLQDASDLFFGLLLRKLLKDPRFNVLIDKLKDLPFGQLDFSTSNLEDKHLAQLARMKNLKELDIEGCKQLTAEGFKNFKQVLGERKVQILFDKDLILEV